VPRSTSHVLTLLEVLQTGRTLTGAQLADRLGVDPRTVRRYVLRLQELGIPVEAGRGRYGGYRLLPGYKLPPLMLTDDEATAVVLGLIAGKRIGLATASTAGESALAKISRVLPAPLGEQVHALAETLDFTLPVRPVPAPATSAVLTLAEAARLRRRTRLRYRSRLGEETERELDPYGLVFHSGKWYVTGHDHRRGEVRTFRVDRVIDVTLDPRTFPDPRGFDPVAHVTMSLANVPYAWEVEVWLGTSVAEARDRIPPTVGVLTEASDGAGPGAGVVFRTRAEKLDGMARMLASLGCEFVIRCPEELRTAVRDLARRLEADASRRLGRGVSARSAAGCCPAHPGRRRADRGRPSHTPRQCPAPGV
jgi:predicted DNA-binding transcriptional regulator YafY